MAQETCSACGGSGIFGSYADNNKCQRCFGTGRITVPDKPGGSGGSGGCFPKGTCISTPFGVREISELEQGDLVVAMNRKNGEKEIRKIVKKLTHNNKQIWQLDFSDGNVVRTTSVHSFSINGKWKKASEIKSGDTITTYDAKAGFGEKLVLASKQTNESEDVFNLIIEGDFNFVADGVIAHSFTYFKSVRMRVWSLVYSVHLYSSRFKAALKWSDNA